MSIDVELIDGRTFRWHVHGRVHRVHGHHLKEVAPSLRRLGLRLLYRCPNNYVEWWAPWWLAWWLGPLLAVRDAAVWSWGMHCFDLGLVRPGERIPLLPRGDWFCFGWYA